MRSRVIEVCLTDQEFLNKAQALYDGWEKKAVLRLIAKRERPLIAKFARVVKNSKLLKAMFRPFFDAALSSALEGAWI